MVGWEARERRRARDWERIESREAEQRRQMAKEARRLRDFLENYDDEKDDRLEIFKIVRKGQNLKVSIISKVLSLQLNKLLY